MCTVQRLLHRQFRSTATQLLSDRLELAYGRPHCVRSTGRLGTGVETVALPALDIVTCHDRITRPVQYRAALQ